MKRIALLVLLVIAEHVHAGGTVITSPVSQKRITGTCSSPNAIIAIAADGSVTCATGTQTLVTGTCAAGSAIRVIASDGSVTCETDDNTTYTNGSGVSLVGTTFSIDSTYTQRRVSGSCAAGSSIASIAEDGSVTCEVDTDTDTNTTYTNGSGLTLVGTTFAIDDTYTQRRVSGSCAAGSSIASIAADGSVTCETDDDTTYTNGSGISLAGTTFAIDPTYTQRRVSGTCAAGSSIATIAVDGTVTCEIDTDTDTNTTYSNGSGLSLVGTVFAIEPTYTQRRVSGTCVAGSSIRVVAEDGTVTCETDDNTTYTNGTGISLAGTTFSIDPTYTQRRVSGTCVAGSSIATIAQDGTVTCETDDNTTYTNGSGLTLVGTTFAIDSTYTQRRVSSTCAVGSSIRVIAADGTVTCQTDSGGISNSAGANVLMKSNGTNAVASSWTDTGTFSSTTGSVLIEVGSTTAGLIVGTASKHWTWYPAGTDLRLFEYTTTYGAGGGSDRITVSTGGATTFASNVTTNGNMTVLNNTVLGNAAGDSVTMTGTLVANGVAGTNGDVLTLVAGLPQWSAPTGGGGVVTGSGTSGKFAKFTSGTSIGDSSLLSESGSTVTLSSASATTLTIASTAARSFSWIADTVAPWELRLRDNTGALDLIQYDAASGGSMYLNSGTTISAGNFQAAAVFAALGTSSFADDVTLGNDVTDTVTVAGPATFNNNASIAGTFGVTGTTTLATVGAGATTASSLTVTGSTTLAATTLTDLTSSGTSSLTTLSVSGNSTLGGIICTTVSVSGGSGTISNADLGQTNAANCAARVAYAGLTLTGMLAGVANRTYTIHNPNATGITLNHESGSSTAANRFRLPGGQNWTINGYGSATLWYDGTSSRWHLGEIATTGMPILTVSTYLGIGTAASANAQQTFSAAVGDKIHLYPISGTNAFGFGVQANTLQYFTNASTDKHSFGYGDSGAFTEGASITGTGVLTLSSSVAAGSMKIGATQARVYLGRRVFTASGAYTPTTGTRAVLVRMVGGGGGGGGAGSLSTYRAAGGGASGVYFEKWITPGTTVTSTGVTVGAAGTAGAANNACAAASAGGAGGNTSIAINGTTYTATGGGGGAKDDGGGSSSRTGGIGGTVTAGSSTGDVVFGQPGVRGYIAGGLFFGGAGGSTPLGAGAQQTSGVTAGAAGTGYGAGGGGGTGWDDTFCGGSTSGGAGSPGIVIVEEYN